MASVGPKLRLPTIKAAPFNPPRAELPVALARVLGLTGPVESQPATTAPAMVASNARRNPGRRPSRGAMRVSFLQARAHGSTPPTAESARRWAANACDDGARAGVRRGAKERRVRVMRPPW